MDDIFGSVNTHRKLGPGRYTDSKIDFVGDQDWFKAELLVDVEYIISLTSLAPDGLADPLLRIHAPNSDVLAEDDNSGNGRNAKIRFTARNTDPLFVAALDAGQGLGMYRLRIRANQDDFANNHVGSGRVNLDQGSGLTAGILEQLGDQDWFRVRLEAGQWYKIETNSAKTPSSFFIRDPNRKKLTSLTRRDRFYATESADHYVVVRSGYGRYDLKVTEGGMPFLSHAGGQVNGNFDIGRAIRTNDFPISTFHLYSDEQLFFGTSYQGRLMPANRVYRAHTGNLWRWSTYFDAKRFSSVLIRGSGTANGHRFSTPWTRFHVTTINNAPLQSGKRWPPYYGRVRVMTYAFATDLPRYFLNDARFSKFKPLTPDQQNAVKEAIRRWDRVEASFEFREVAPGTNNDQATMMIFSSDIPQHVSGFYPEKNGGSDLVLNMDSPLLTNLSSGTRGFYEILRGVGNTLGLKSDNGFGRYESVMGRRADSGSSDAVYLSSPGPADISALTEYRRANNYFKNTKLGLGDSIYAFVPGDAQTISDFGGMDTIDARGTDPVIVDLRPGATSRRLTGQTTTSVISLALDSGIENVLSGSGNDRLLGNGWDNRLSAGDGRDLLEGRAGDDELLGGKGNDVYRYEFADGDDQINETDGGGRDRLEIHGMFSFNDLTDDLLFQKTRNGKDLLITLALDGDDANNQGSIRIRNMDQRQAQIETLSVSNTNRFFGDISLRNLFAQASATPQRFHFTQEDDPFGRLVAPVTS